MILLIMTLFQSGRIASLPRAFELLKCIFEVEAGQTLGCFIIIIIYYIVLYIYIYILYNMYVYIYI